MNAIELTACFFGIDAIDRNLRMTAKKPVTQPGKLSDQTAVFGDPEGKFIDFCSGKCKEDI